MMVCVSNSYCVYVEVVFVCIGFVCFFGDWLFCVDLVVWLKLVLDVYLVVVCMFGVVFVNCLVVEDSVIGIIVVVVVGMIVFGFVGGGYVLVVQIDVLCSIGVCYVFDDMYELFGYVVCWQVMGVVLFYQ